jgi:hypothetical protein
MDALTCTGFVRRTGAPRKKVDNLAALVVSRHGHAAGTALQRWAPDAQCASEAIHD